MKSTKLASSVDDIYRQEKLHIKTDMRPGYKVIQSCPNYLYLQIYLLASFQIITKQSFIVAVVVCYRASAVGRPFPR